MEGLRLLGPYQLADLSVKDLIRVPSARLRGLSETAKAELRGGYDFEELEEGVPRVALDVLWLDVGHLDEGIGKLLQ